MLALHAAWSTDNRLHVWSEDGSWSGATVAGVTGGGRTAKVPARRPRSGRSAAAPAPTPAHPGAGSAESVAGAIASAFGARGAALVPAPASAPGSLTLLLPTRRGRPIPSPEAIAGGLHALDGTIELAPWTVPTRVYEAPAAIDLLLAIGPDSPAMAIGASVRYFGAAAQLALDLVLRGRVLPGIAEENGRGSPSAAINRALWLPCPGAGDVARLGTLARQMPPVCRAESVPIERLPGAPGAAGGGSPQTLGRSAAVILREFIVAAVDAIVRASVELVALPAGLGGRDARSAWLRALVAPDPTIASHAPGLGRIAAALAAWRRAATPTARPFRTCFRLVPPIAGAGEAEGVVEGRESDSETTPLAPSPPGPASAGEDTWRLEFLLQARDDPSLLVPAEGVWGSGHEEDLLADLGRVTRLYPPLDPALSVAHPIGQDLDTAGAHAFLLEGGPLLADAGFGIILPSWWRQGRPRLGARLRARARSAGGSGSVGVLGLESLATVEWDVALGDATLSADELHALAELKAPLVRVRGKWVEVRPDEIAAALRLVEGARGAGSMPVRDLLRIGLGLSTDEVGLPIDGIEASGWLGTLVSGDAIESRLDPIPTPAGFHGELRPYQERGLGWLAFLGGLGLGACLADDMGLGKTAQVLALLVAERAAPADDGAGDDGATGFPPRRLAPTLVVCPMSVVGNWQREAERFAPGLGVHVHHGSGRLDAGALAELAAGVDLVITTYNLVVRDAVALAAIPWGRVVLDEAQAIKNSVAQQTQAVRRLAAAQRVALTGTPVENRLSDLWSIMEVLNPGLLGSATTSRCGSRADRALQHDDAAANLLRRVTGPFILRRLKSDRSIIAGPAGEARDDGLLQPDPRAGHALPGGGGRNAREGRCERGHRAPGPDPHHHAPAQAGLQPPGAPARRRIGQFRVDPGSWRASRKSWRRCSRRATGRSASPSSPSSARCSRPHLRARFGREVLWLHGGTRKAARDDMVASFQAAGGPPIFLLSLKAGGTGLNLTAANHVIHVDRWWNPAVENQATDRAYRIGQQRNVQVRKLVCVGTFEERIAEMIEAKRELAERIVGTGEAWLTELSTAELRRVVALSSDAVGEG